MVSWARFPVHRPKSPSRPSDHAGIERNGLERLSGSALAVGQADCAVFVSPGEDVARRAAAVGRSFKARPLCRVVGMAAS